MLISFNDNPVTKQVETTQVRNLYKQAALNEESCLKLISLLDGFNEKNNALLAGYKACGTMMMAKYAFFPMTKLQKFSSGRELLEKSIQQSPANTELRFLRFTIQTNTPAFLGYNDQLSNDKSFLIKILPLIKDKELQVMISEYLKKSNLLSVSEKQILNL